MHFEVSMHSCQQPLHDWIGQTAFCRMETCFLILERHFAVESPCSTAASTSMAHNIAMLAGQQSEQRSVDPALSAAFPAMVTFAAEPL